jgi:tetratricopeptide (TPR) repeat protein
LGLACERLGDFERAREAFAAALASRRIDQRVPAVDILERWGRAALQTGRADEARRAAELALAEDPASVPARLLAAAALLRQGRPSDALRFVQPLLSRDAATPAPWMLAADALDALGRSEEARQLRSEASRRFPADAAVRAALRR